MGRPYALNTTVSISSTHIEITGLIERFGVGNLATGRMAGRDFVMFDHEGQTYRFVVEPQDDPAEERRQWRCLVLYIRAALVLVQEGVRDLDSVFLADRVLPNGQSWGDYAKDTKSLPRASAFKLLESSP